jgi:hypothetical protein
VVAVWMPRALLLQQVFETAGVLGDRGCQGWTQRAPPQLVCLSQPGLGVFPPGTVVSRCKRRSGSLPLSGR